MLAAFCSILCQDDLTLFLKCWGLGSGENSSIRPVVTDFQSTSCAIWDTSAFSSCFPFPMRAQWTVDGSTEGPDASLSPSSSCPCITYKTMLPPISLELKKLFDDETSSRTKKKKLHPFFIPAWSNCSIMGVLESIPAVIGWEAGYTLDKSPVHHRATQRQLC